MPAKSELDPDLRVLIERVDAVLDLKVLTERVDTVLREASQLLADLQLSRTHRVRMVEIGQGGSGGDQTSTAGIAPRALRQGSSPLDHDPEVGSTDTIVEGPR